MKLYTEEQVRKMLFRAEDFLYLDYAHDAILSEHTPIKLPTDEEIDKIAKIVSHCEFEFIQGAEWVIELIKQQAG